MLSLTPIVSIEQIQNYQSIMVKCCCPWHCQKESTRPTQEGWKKCIDCGEWTHPSCLDFYSPQWKMCVQCIAEDIANSDQDDEEDED